MHGTGLATVWRALSFDVDGTLVDRDQALRAHLADRLDPSQVARALELDDGHRNTELLRWLETEAGFRSVDAARRWLLRWPEQIRACPDTRAMLERLARRHQLLIVSNGNPRQRAKLERAGLGGLFAPVLLSSELRSAKPSPGMFRRASQATGIPPGKMLHVGDTLRDDVEGATRAGFGTCWLARGRPLPKGAPLPDLVIDRLLELEERLG